MLKVQFTFCGNLWSNFKQSFCLFAYGNNKSIIVEIKKPAIQAMVLFQVFLKG